MQRTLPLLAHACPALPFLLPTGPYPFLLESTSWCDMLVGMRLLDEEGSELAQKCIDLTDDIYAKIEEVRGGVC